PRPDVVGPSRRPLSGPPISRCRARRRHMTMVLTHPAKRRLAWQPCWCLVPIRFPPIDLFARIAAPADWPALAALESLTDPRIRQERGELALMPAEARIEGPGAPTLL